MPHILFSVNLTAIQTENNSTTLKVNHVSLNAFRKLRSFDMNAFLTMKSIEHCVRDIHSWMLNDYAKLNNNKTEYLIIRTPQKGKIGYLTLCGNLSFTFPSLHSFS